MKITRGKDGGYSAIQVGAMGRVCFGDGRSMGEAALKCATLLKDQKGECYAHEQSMSHLADVSYGEGAYGQDLG